jgi:hypothetical protein
MWSQKSETSWKETSQKAKKQEETKTNYTVWILITKMQRKAVKGSVYEEILWLEVHNFDDRGNVALKS